MIRNKQDKMSRVCNIHGGKRYAYGVWWENLKERNNVEDLSIDRCIIL
jgi:hypothetical protein